MSGKRLSDDQRYLRGCPFCGRRQDLEVKLQPADTVPLSFVHFVSCGSCFAQGPKMIYKHEAIEIWNERARSVSKPQAKV
jgi:hypothetical protein